MKEGLLLLGINGGAAHWVIPRPPYVLTVLSGGLAVYSVADPLVPRKEAFIPASGVCSVTWEPSGRLIFLDNDSIQVYIVSPPSPPLKVGRTVFEERPTALLVDGDLAYVALRRRDFVTLQLIETGLQEVSRSPIGGSITHIARAGDLLLLADVSGLKVMAGADTGRPFLVGRTNFPGWPKDVWMLPDHVLVADVVGLKLHRRTKTGRFDTVGRLTAPGWRTARLWVAAPLVFVADESVGLHIVSIKEPSQPVLLCTVHLTGGAWDVEVRDNMAYVAGASSGLHLIDVADPSNAHLINSVEVSGEALGVHLGNSSVWVAASRGGVSELSLDGSNPALQTVISTMDTAWDVVYTEGYLYVADGKGGLLTFKKDGHDFLRVHRAEAGEARGLWLDGKELWVACGGDGVRCFDLAIPSTPRLHVQRPLDGFARSVSVHEGTACVALGDGGFAVLKRSGE